MVAPLGPSPFSGSVSYALVSRTESLPVARGKSVQVAARPGTRFKLVKITELGQEAADRVIAIATPEGDLAILADDGTRIVLQRFFSTEGAMVELPGQDGQSVLVDARTPRPSAASGGYDIVHAAGEGHSLASLAHDFAAQYDVLQPDRFSAAVTSLNAEPFSAGISSHGMIVLAGGLIGGGIAAVAGAAGGSSSPAAQAGGKDDTKQPTVSSLSFLPVTGDNYISVAEEEEGVQVTGLASGLADETVVTVQWGGITKQTRIYEGIWSVTYENVEIPSNAQGQRITASAGGFSAEVRVTFETMNVQKLEIDVVAGDDRVALDERAAGVVVSGLAKNAPDGSVVTVDWRGHSIDAVVSGGRWSVTFAADAVPQESSDVSTEINAYMVDVSASRAVVVAGEAPPLLVGLSIDAVSGDNAISAAEREGDVMVSGTATGLADGTQVTLGWGAATRTATVSNGLWSAIFARDDIPLSDTAIEVSALDASNQTVAASTFVTIAYPTVMAARIAANDGGYAVAVPQQMPGASLAEIGDVNRDGLSDFVVGVGGSGGVMARAYVVFGSSSGTAHSLDDIAAGIGGFEIVGEADGPPPVVSSAGDVDGDGLADILVGAPGNGNAYVIFGATTGAFSASRVDIVGTPAGDTMSDEGSESVFAAGAGNDTITLFYADSVVLGGLGDDVVHIDEGFIDGVLSGDASLPFGRIDGGGGFDTLAIDGAGLHLDMTAIGNPGAGLALSASRFESIERIDLTGSGDNRLTISLADIMDMAASNILNSGIGWAGLAAIERAHQLVVTGNTGDSVSLASRTGWSDGGTAIFEGVTYHIVANASAGAALYIQDGVTGPLTF